MSSIFQVLLKPGSDRQIGKSRIQRTGIEMLSSPRTSGITSLESLPLHTTPTLSFGLPRPEQNGSKRPEQEGRDPMSAEPEGQQILEWSKEQGSGDSRPGLESLFCCSVILTKSQPLEAG